MLLNINSLVHIYKKILTLAQNVVYRNTKIGDSTVDVYGRNTANF